jgi:hypothetical protein
MKLKRYTYSYLIALSINGGYTMRFRSTVTSTQNGSAYHCGKIEKDIKKAFILKGEPFELRIIALDSDN